MNIWLGIILFIHVLVALGIIGLVLLQHGKGADVGAAFGSGASGSLFGATGSANFLSRATAILAVVFFLTSLGLTYLATHAPRSAGGVMDAVKDAPASSTSAPASSTGAPAQTAPAAKADTVPGAATSAPAPSASGKNPDAKTNEVPK